jgi:hypothetical protein
VDEMFKGFDRCVRVCVFVCLRVRVRVCIWLGLSGKISEPSDDITSSALECPQSHPLI